MSADQHVTITPTEDDLKDVLKTGEGDFEGSINGQPVKVRIRIDDSDPFEDEENDDE